MFPNRPFQFLFFIFLNHVVAASHMRKKYNKLYNLNFTAEMYIQKKDGYHQLYFSSGC